MGRYNNAKAVTGWQMAQGQTKEEIYNVVKEDLMLVGWRKQIQKTWVWTVQGNDQWLLLKAEAKSRDNEMFSCFTETSIALNILHWCTQIKKKKENLI